MGGSFKNQNRSIDYFFPRSSIILKRLILVKEKWWNERKGLQFRNKFQWVDGPRYGPDLRLRLKSGGVVPLNDLSSVLQYGMVFWGIRFVKNELYIYFGFINCCLLIILFNTTTTLVVPNSLKSNRQRFRVQDVSCLTSSPTKKELLL